MCIHRKYIYLSALVYLSIPLYLFLLSWLHIYYGAFCTVVLLFCAYRIFQHVKKNVGTSSLCIGRYHVFSLLLILLFLFITGHGGFIGTNGVDIPWRDAIYNDLIRYPWPIVYEHSHTMLIYYLTYWLLPAGISWLFGLGTWGSHVVLFFWSYMGLSLVFLLLCDYLQPAKNQVLFVCGLFLLWSGLSLFGMMLKSLFGASAFRIDDYPGFYSWQFTAGMYDGHFIGYFLRTTFDSVANVYNQYIPMAVVTLLFLECRYMYDMYAFLGLLALPYSPLGFVGIVLLMMGDGVYQIIHDIRQGERLLSRHIKKYISLENLLSGVIILPVFYFYFTVNSMSQKAVETGILAAPLSAYGLFRIGNLLLFYLLSFGMYCFLLYRDNRLNFLYWWASGILILLPFFRVGLTGDFLWNASVAPYLFIMMLALKQLLSAWDKKQFWGADLLLLICVLVAAITPLMQMTTSIRGCFLQKQVSVYLDAEKINGTFADKPADDLLNFLAKEYKEQIFYKYLSKK